MSNNSSCNKISEICAPLFNNINLNYLGYGRAYEDGSMFDLSSNNQWVDHFTAEKYVGIGFTGKQFCSGYYTHYSGLGELMPIEQFVTASNAFNMHYPLVIVKRFDNYYEYFLLTSKKSNRRIYDFYFNNKDVLEKITAYFKEKAQSIIQLSEKHKTYIPKQFSDTFSISSNQKQIIYGHDMREKLLQVIKPKKHELQLFNGQKIYLPKQQYICLLGYVYGRSAKEIALELNVTYRTVQSYILIIKRKTGLNSKIQLRKLLENSQINPPVFLK